MGWTAGDGGVEREGAQKLRTTGNITTNETTNAGGEESASFALP